MRMMAWCALGVLAVGCTTYAPNLESRGVEAVPDEVLLGRELPEDEAREAGLEALAFDPVTGFGRYRILDGRTPREAARDAVARWPETRAEPNLYREALSNDPLFELQWNLRALDIETAWEHGRGEGVVVAVVDSGVAGFLTDGPVHRVPGKDFVDGDDDPTDGHGHGTVVASILAASADNAVGIAGVAPEVSVLPVRVLGDDGIGSAFQIAQGIVFAVDEGADVINLSLGSFAGSGAEQEAVRYALERGVIVVAGSGNFGEAGLLFPAAYPGVLSVGALDARGEVAAYSHTGAGLDLVAPGGFLAADDNQDGQPDGIPAEARVSPNETEFRLFQGTSMATPHVSGAAALLLAAGASPGSIAGRLQRSARDLGEPGWDAESGAGALDVVTALEELASETSTPDPGDPGNGTSDPQPDPSLDPADSAPFTLDAIDIDRFGPSLRVRWETDVPASSELVFLGHDTVGTPALVTDHELQITVDPWETYFMWVRSTDASGATVTSDLEVVFLFD